MTLSEALYSRLSGYAGVIALTSARIYPVVIPQKAKLPAVTFQQVSKTPVHAMVQDARLYEVRVQVSAWSTGYAQVKSVSKQVENALKDYSGVMGGVGGITVQRSFMDMETDLYDQDSELGNTAFHVAQDYIIWHTSST